jgi:hypothetical protein
MPRRAALTCCAAITNSRSGTVPLPAELFRDGSRPYIWSAPDGPAAHRATPVAHDGARAALEHGRQVGRFNSANFADRITSTTAAKQALVEKLKAKPADDDPEVLRKRAEREAIAEARAKRMAEKDEQRRQQALREAEEKAARAAAEAAAEAERQALVEQEKAAAEAARLERAARILSDEAERKIARDARYAARKARVRGG